MDHVTFSSNKSVEDKIYILSNIIRYIYIFIIYVNIKFILEMITTNICCYIMDDNRNKRRPNKIFSCMI